LRGTSSLPAWRRGGGVGRFAPSQPSRGNRNSWRLFDSAEAWRRATTAGDGNSSNTNNNSSSKTGPVEGSGVPPQPHERGNNRDLNNKIKSKDFVSVMKIYEEMKEAGKYFSKDMYNAFLSVCYLAEHYDAAKEMFDNMTEKRMEHSEQTYLALIRCLAAGGRIDESLGLVEDMEKIPLELKSRTFWPIFEATCEQGNVPEALDLIDLMMTKGVRPRTDYITLLLETAIKTNSLNPVASASSSSSSKRSRSKSNVNDTAMRKNVYERTNALITQAAESDFLGLPSVDLHRLVAVLGNETLFEVKEKGILVQSVSDIPGPYIGDLLSSNGVPVKAFLKSTYNILNRDGSYSGSPYMISPFNSSNFSFMSSNASTSASCMGHPDELYNSSFWTKIDTNLKEGGEEGGGGGGAGVHGDAASSSVYEAGVEASSPAVESSFSSAPAPARVATAAAADKDDDVLAVIETYRVIDDLSPQASTRKGNKILQQEKSALGVGSSASMVEISNTTQLCPNCGGKLKSFLLNDEERERVKMTMRNMVALATGGGGSEADKERNVQVKKLLQFEAWVEQQQELHGEFDFIIDGANVAYHKQNYIDGRFNYHQVDVIVEVLRAQGKRVLLLLPTSYAQKVIPNTTRGKGLENKRVLTYITKEDSALLEKWERENMLYKVPGGANDDWYWIYVTLCGRRKNPAYVVTNDLMRDHRLAFLEPRPFVRWRSTQIVHFDFVRPNEQEEEDHDEDEEASLALDNNAEQSVAAAEQSISKEADTSGSIYTADDLVLIMPGSYSREIQRSDNGHWHIPSLDRSSWMCMSLNGTLIGDVSKGPELKIRKKRDEEKKKEERGGKARGGGKGEGKGGGAKEKAAAAVGDEAKKTSKQAKGSRQRQGQTKQKQSSTEGTMAAGGFVFDGVSPSDQQSYQARYLSDDDVSATRND